MKNNRTFLEKLLDGAEVEWKTLDEIFHLKNGYTPSKGVKEYWENGSIPWFRMEDIRENGRVLNTALQKVSESAVKGGKLFPANSIILSTTATIGEHALVQVEHLSNQQLTNFSIKEEFLKCLDIKFAFHYFFLIGNQIKKSANFSSLPIVSSKDLKKIQMPIPPLSVQTEIVKILDALTALTSELTSELILRRKQYEYYRETLLLPDNLEQLNTEGAKKKLSDVVNIYLGLTYTPTYVENGVKFISAQNTSNDFLDLSNTKFISREEFEKSTSNAKPKRGDILFTRVGSNLGHPVIVDTDEDLCIFVSLGFLRVKDKNTLNSYIKHWMNTNLFWKQVEKNVHGSAKVNLNTGWLKDFEIYIPTLKEQQCIVSILDKFETLTNSINEGLPLAIEQSQKRYEYYRELLLNFPDRE